MAGGSYFEVEARVVAPGVVARIAALIEPAAEAIERRLQEAVRRGLSGGGNPGTQGSRQGIEFADAFSRVMKTRLEAAFRSLPKLKIDANSSDVDREVAEIRRKLQAASRAIDLGVDTKLINEQLASLRLRLKALSGDADIKVRLNAKTALAELEALKRATQDDNKRGNIFTRLIADARVASPLFDGVVTKLGAVGGAFSQIGGGNLVGAIAIASAIVALLSTIGPLVAAATGALIGLAGVAGVAALAVLGFKRQMEQQTGFGQVIGDQFKTISREASGLATVAANALGPGLRDVFGLVKQALPGFEGLITAVGGRLGGTLRVVGQTLITAFQRASPLILEVAGYIEAGAAALQRWVAGPGFDKFLAYARQQLPVVIGFVRDFGKALIDTFVALAPVGENVIKVLDFLFKLISKIAPALRGLVDIALPFVGITDLLGGLFGSDNDNSKSQSAVDGLLKSYQDLATGAADTAVQAAPLDRYRSVIGDLAPALQLAAGNAGQFQVAVSGITDRLDAATPAMATYLETAAQYVTSFAAGGVKAADTVKLLADAFTASRGPALDYATAMTAADTATQNIAKTVADNRASIDSSGKLLGVSYLDASGKFVDASNQFSAGSQQIVQGLQEQISAATNAATATYQNELATRGQATAANDALTVYKGYRQSLIDSIVAQGTARSSAEALADQYFAIPSDVDTFVKLLGQGDVNTAIIGLTTALNRLSDFIGAPKVELNKTDFDNGLAQVASGLDYYGNAKATPTADLDINPFNAQTANVSAAISDLTNQQANPRADLDTSAYNNQAAVVRGSLADLNAAHAQPSVSINDLASGKLASIQAYMNSLHDKNITLSVTQTNSLNKNAAMAAVSARGNLFSSVGHYAQGGIIDKLRASVPSFANGAENHVPQIAMPNGGVRIWAEPETGGESYIPLANDSRRPRALQIWAQTGERLGAFAASSGSSRTADMSALVGEVAALRADVRSVEQATLYGAGHVAGTYKEAVGMAAGLARQTSAAGSSDRSF